MEDAVVFSLRDGKKQTLEKYLSFAGELNRIFGGARMPEEDVRAIVAVAMDFMMNYAGDCYERGLQKGAVIGYENGWQAALESAGVKREHLLFEMMEGVLQ